MCHAKEILGEFSFQSSKKFIWDKGDMKGFKSFVIFPDLKGYIKADFDFTVSSSLQFPIFGFSYEVKEK